jgi:hypothetical protein
MNEEAFNLGVRKFLKMVGVNSQREIEQAVAKAIADGRIAGIGSLSAAVTLQIPELGAEARFEGRIDLE